MLPLPPETREIAELFKLHMPMPKGQERVLSPRYAAFIGRDPHPARNAVQRLRLLPDEVAETVEEIRALYRARGRTRVMWEIGPSSAPADLFDRLAALGLSPDAEGEPIFTGMVLAHPLPASPSSTNVTVRRVTTPEDFHASALIYHVCFYRGEPEPTVEATSKLFYERREDKASARYLALIDGEPVATASAMFAEHAVGLGGGATLPKARGKGAYVALIAARWEDAVARGTPVLVTQAGAMSRPILRRLGFEEVVEIRILLDSFG